MASEPGLIEELDRVNEHEGQQLAQAMQSREFLLKSLQRALGSKSKRK